MTVLFPLFDLWFCPSHYGVEALQLLAQFFNLVVHNVFGR